MSDPEPKPKKRKAEPIPEKSSYLTLNSKQLFIAIVLIIAFIVCIVILILFIVLRFWDKSKVVEDDESESEESEEEDVYDILDSLEAEIMDDEEEVKNARAELYTKTEPSIEVLDEVSSSVE